MQTSLRITGEAVSCKPPGSGRLRRRYTSGWLPSRRRDPVDHIGIEIGAARPGDGTRLFVYPNSRKFITIAERPKHRASEERLDVDVSNLALAEDDPDHIGLPSNHRDNVLSHHGSGSIGLRG